MNKSDGQHTSTGNMNVNSGCDSSSALARHLTSLFLSRYYFYLYLYAIFSSSLRLLDFAVTEIKANLGRHYNIWKSLWFIITAAFSTGRRRVTSSCVEFVCQAFLTVTTRKKTCVESWWYWIPNKFGSIFTTPYTVLTRQPLRMNKCHKCMLLNTS